MVFSEKYRFWDISYTLPVMVLLSAHAQQETVYKAMWYIGYESMYFLNDSK